MGVINVLDRQTAELIAAGEVVERPAAVIKELMENSVDSGATRISVEIKNGGVTYMRVTDNGFGISPDDISKAFLSHATSKIKSPDDLNAIFTMGFRGEALASIAAMCRVEVLTKTEAENGVRYVIEGGEELESCPAGCPDGTTITVRDIFYNTPARMKFLKKDSTEGTAIMSVAERVALSHPEIAVNVIRDGKTVLVTPGNGKPQDAVYAVLGAESYRAMVPVSYSGEGISVEGFVSLPESPRHSRAGQIFFINRRFVRSGTFTAALEAAFRTLITKGRFPAAVLNVTMPPEVFDINVHPAKLEVRFENEKRAFDAVYRAVMGALAKLPQLSARSLSVSGGGSGGGSSSETLNSALTPNKSPAAGAAKAEAAPSLGAAGRNAQPVLRQGGSSGAAYKEGYSIHDGQLHISAGEYRRLTGKEFLGRGERVKRISPLVDDPSLEEAGGAPDSIKAERKTEVLPEVENGAPSALKAGALPNGNNEALLPPQADIEQIMEKPDTVPPVAKVSESPPLLPSPEGERLSELPLIGEAFSTYIMLEHGDELVLIDKHAAHERLIYERLISSKEAPSRQTLLDPPVLSVTRQEQEELLGNLELLASLGFMCEDFGEGSVVLREIPQFLDIDTSREVLLELAASGLSGTSDTLDRIYHTIACKAAIKGRIRSDRAELSELLRQLDEQPNVRSCPHGRPISAAIKRSAIERLFSRSQ